MNKTVILICFLIVSLFCTADAQTGRLVAVTAEKEVDIKNNDVAAARTIALAMAARDAVEKGYGTYVKVEQMQNLRQVIATAASTLKYRILAEQKKGNRYWVKIQANVSVPEEYAGAAQPEREGLGESMGNFVQKYPQGEINWGDGMVLAHGKGEIVGAGAANAEQSATRAAELDAKAHLLEIINDIPVDDRSRIREQPQMAFTLEGFIRNAEVVAKSKLGTTVHVTVQAPIRGVQGLTMTIHGYYTPEPPPPAVAQQPIQPAPVLQAESYTGVVIDARKASVNAAIFPKVADTKKREVYNVKQVNLQDLEKRGMASYAVVARDVQISKRFPHAIIIPVRYAPEGAPAKEKAKRRQGYKPFVVTAAQAGGTLQTNLIISEEDAKKLKAIDDKTNVLKECKVVVVVSSEVGGLEGQLRTTQNESHKTHSDR